MINPFTFASGSTQSQHQTSKLPKCARQSVLLWRDALPPSPLRILRGVSTSLNVNCSSAPSVSVWSTCVASANAVTSHKAIHESLVLRSHLDATALLAACDSTEADKLFSASTRSAFSVSNDVVNSATSAFALVKSPVELCKLVLKRLLEQHENCEQRLTRRGECRRARSGPCPINHSAHPQCWSCGLACHNHKSGQLIVAVAKTVVAAVLEVTGAAQATVRAGVTFSTRERHVLT